MDKPYVFVSHISQEAKLAELLKTQISHDFLGMIDVFVSSDSTSITVGSKWLNDIDAALKNAKVELIICSEDSVSRPWINFEAGAGWVKGIPIVPICHTGLRPVDLPIPLNMLQGIQASDSAGLQRVYELLAKQLGCAVPNQAFADFIQSVKGFEREYGIVRRVRYHVSGLIKLLPDLRQIFQPSPAHKLASGSINNIVFDKMQQHLDGLQKDGYLNYATDGGVSIAVGPGGGVMLDLKIQVNESYYKLATEVFREIA